MKRVLVPAIFTKMKRERGLEKEITLMNKVIVLSVLVVRFEVCSVGQGDFV